jgi:uncharacterized protein with PQ loop repeat
MVIAGLALTVAGWLVQIYLTVFKKDTKINPIFLVTYAVGCIILTISNFTSSEVAGGVLNLLDVILPLTIVWTIMFVRKAAS